MSPGGSWFAAIVAIACVALPSAAIAAGAGEGRRRDRLMLLVAAVAGIGGLAALLGYVLATGHDAGAALGARLGAAMPEILAFYKSSGWPEASVVAWARVLDTTRLALTLFFPGIVLAGCVFHAALVVYTFGRVLELREPEVEAVPFARFTTPLAAAALFVPAGLVAAIGPAPLVPLAVDLLLPLAALFFLRGLAIIRALLDRGRAGLIGRVLVFTLAFQMPFPVILALGGLFDEFLDVRGRLERRDRERTLRSDQ